MTDVARKLKRNDIVCEKDVAWVVYGRVNRVIDAETVEWIDCCKQINISKMSDLVLANDYKGRHEEIRIYNRDRYGEIIYPDNWMNDENVLYKLVFNRFYRMPTLRKLKQRASHYAGRNAWRVEKRPDAEYRTFKQ